MKVKFTSSLLGRSKLRGYELDRTAPDQGPALNFSGGSDKYSGLTSIKQNII
jgi:hypothetical protein